MITIIILTKDGFKEKQGIMIHKDYGIYKEDKRWFITDLPSGLLVKGGLKTTTECEEWIKLTINRLNVEKLKRNEKYKKRCNDLKSYSITLNKERKN